ncbi:MAG: ubiquinol-cytochrome c reductase iron-sulfur subunit [Chloroflexota bacterium]|nr:ubiquinol-cytochrome c reductase iron-sulfur subunit [Chloroflexota bacterium]
MATEIEPRNAGRRIITQEEADAIQAKARPDAPPPPPRRSRIKITRREALVYAFAGSTALYLGAIFASMTAPDPEVDPLLKSLVPEETARLIPGGFAYPRFRAGEFGGQFVLTRTADSYTLDQPPDLNSSGKFYVVKVDAEPGTDQNPNPPAGEHIIAIYQVCTHLGCLIPFIQSENRFFCPCHGSTFERNSQFVRGPAPRNLDQFATEVAADGTITVDTGSKMTGKAH